MSRWVGQYTLVLAISLMFALNAFGRQVVTDGPPPEIIKQYFCIGEGDKQWKRKRLGEDGAGTFFAGKPEASRG